MTTHITSAIIVAALAVVGMFAGVGAERVADPRVEPPARVLALARLDYVDGYVIQGMFSSTPGLPGTWKAAVLKPVENFPPILICGRGGGVGSYHTREQAMDLNIWVGSEAIGQDCHARMKVGEEYILDASWEYENEYKNATSFVGSHSFIYTGPPVEVGLVLPRLFP